MNAVAITLISVIGTGLISAFLIFIRMIFGLINNLSDQFSGIRTEVHDGFREHGERLARIEAIAIDHGERLARIEETAKDQGERLARIEETAKDQGERLARIEATAIGQSERLTRIEAKLDNDPPAEAA